ncbi:helix-turn-helix transcriptional regulator [Gloeocapsopsis crepidinum LEGE 06123]|uniref:Helix-turn-helix transcriptional regulator n=1 Tax=Gloeocapsopsis crepidinum LEGE 06123 TaxID=588587 RepID=A0ABR9UXI8_9CHRO|nr:AraC family transcriptional regulator [Gloeocapsopsis crepidinum]MBE9193035.1 helix-turn-helix transcriptional regulator [Gloeocapsopsis crepidinum LEGE 06123]
MTLTISEVDYAHLWQESVLEQEFCNSSEVMEVCPQALGTGYRRWVMLRDIDLLIHDYEFHQDVQVKSSPGEGGLEIGFQLQGGSYAKRYAGQNFVQNGPHDTDTTCERAGEHILQVDIHLELDSLKSFVPNDIEPSLAIQQLIQASGQYPYTQVSETTATMQFVLNQLLNCPYEGLTKQIYLESKCWELVALRLEQLNGESSLQTGLKPDDIERIHEAKAILTRNWQTPPSLLELARQVGLNDYKLKQGFRQVIGTTAFDFLWHYRMEQGRQLLTESQYNVKEVATIVGYSKQSNFAAAFRKKFGMNPKVYQSSQACLKKDPLSSQKNPFSS